MRVIAGKFAGRDLVSPNDFRVRPTSEHVRVALFESLRGELEEARILDLFAGTGSLGIEALSRGARSVDFVETRPASLHALRANVAALRLRESTRIFKRDALPFAGALTADAYDMAFVDPPYDSRMLDRVLDGWKRSHFARTLVCEHARTHDLPKGAQRLTFEETLVTIYRA